MPFSKASRIGVDDVWIQQSETLSAGAHGYLTRNVLFCLQIPINRIGHNKLINRVSGSPQTSSNVFLGRLTIFAFAHTNKNVECES